MECFKLNIDTLLTKEIENTAIDFIKQKTHVYILSLSFVLAIFLLFFGKNILSLLVFLLISTIYIAYFIYKKKQIESIVELLKEAWVTIAVVKRIRKIDVNDSVSYEILYKYSVNNTFKEYKYISTNRDDETKYIVYNEKKLLLLYEITPIIGIKLFGKLTKDIPFNKLKLPKK